MLLMSFHAGPEACVRPVTGRSPPLGHCSRPPCSPCDPACRSPYPQGGQLVSVAALCPSVSRSHLPPDVLPPEDLSAPSGQGSQLGGGPCVAPGDSQLRHRPAPEQGQPGHLCSSGTRVRACSPARVPAPPGSEPESPEALWSNSGVGGAGRCGGRALELWCESFLLRRCPTASTLCFS